MKHPKPIVLHSKSYLETNEDSVKAAMELLKNGTQHLEAEIIPSVTDTVGRGLQRIGFEQTHLTGTKTGNTLGTKI